MKKQRGITLIALVITIIVILILAGVSINLVAGQNGVLLKSQNAVEESKKAIALEQVTMAWATIQADYLVNGAGQDKSMYFTVDRLNVNLSQGEITEVRYGAGDSELVYKITESGTTVYYRILVTTEGKVSVVGEVIETAPTNPTLLSKVKENPAEYYGKKVSGYTANGISDWRIFYADETNVYLITTDYLPADKAISSNDTMVGNNKYNVCWSTVPEVASTANVNKFSPVVEGETIEWTGDYAKNISGKCVSTLLDTSKWTDFVDTAKADMAIGSPTLNMWVASWNEKYDDYKIYCNNTSANGYYLGTQSKPKSTLAGSSKSEGYQVEETENMYYPHKSTLEKCNGYWLASPSGTGTSSIYKVYGSYPVSYDNYNYNYLSVRPVVSLLSSVTTASTEADSVIVLD